MAVQLNPLRVWLARRQPPSRADYFETLLTGVASGAITTVWYCDALPGCTQCSMGVVLTHIDEY
jgi:hypothetical protein